MLQHIEMWHIAIILGKTCFFIDIRINDTISKILYATVYNRVSWFGLKGVNFKRALFFLQHIWRTRKTVIKFALQYFHFKVLPWHEMAIFSKNKNVFSYQRKDWAAIGAKNLYESFCHKGAKLVALNLEPGH